MGKGWGGKDMGFKGKDMGMGWGGFGGEMDDPWGCGMMPPMMGMSGKGYGKMCGKKGDANGCFGKGGGGGGGSKATPTGQAFTGYIKSFKPDMNYGFIECPEVKAEYGNDVFTHGSELTGHPLGEAVYF